MNERTFIEQLSVALKALPAEQRDDILQEYRSHFFEAKERGKSEEDIAKGFGDPRAIAHTYVADYHFLQWQTPSQGQSTAKSIYHLLRGLIIMFSLLFFNFFIMLWPVLFLAILIGVAWLVVSILTVVSAGFAVFAVFGGGGGVFPTVDSQLALFFYACGLSLFGVLSGIGLYHLSKWSVRGLLQYIKLNINLVSA